MEAPCVVGETLGGGALRAAFAHCPAMCVDTRFTLWYVFVLV